MKAIAIDDEPIALDIIRSHAAKVSFLEMRGYFTDAFEALPLLQKENIDLIFLDIKMPDISGIDFFNSLSKKPLVIFTTAYSEHAAVGFELDAADYLLKPISLARFVKGCNKAYELFSARNGDEKAEYMFIKTGFEQHKVLMSDILYLEASGNYVTYVLKDKKILTRSTFADAANALPEDNFVRVHRSFIVAANKIDKIEKYQLVIGDAVIPVSDAYIKQLHETVKRQRP